MDIDDILLQAEEKMQKSLDSLNYDFGRVRTGRANPKMLEPVMVEYYGAKTPLNQVAGISTPEPTQLLVKPYDKSIIKDVEKAILASNLGVTPNNEGEQIRIVLPKLNEERRQALVKQVKQTAEDARVKVRNARREANEGIKKLEKASKLTEDDSIAYQEDVQDLTDKYIDKIDKALESKEKDLMTV